MRYDYLLTGASGQVGRYLLREFLSQGKTVVTVMNRKSVWEALNELSNKTGIPAYKLPVDIVLGDLNDPKLVLPEADRIVNAAGYTALSSPGPEKYWRQNIMVAIKLAHYANFIGARLYQLSSVAVAEFRTGIMTEMHTPIPDERQLTYSTSKTLVELATRAIQPECQILRIGDVVPTHDRIREDLRYNHWLPILFSYGQRGFEYAPDNYSVWLSDASELAKAISILMDYPNSCYHVLGTKYDWRFFRSHARVDGKKFGPVVEWMSKIILYGPEANMVDDFFTTTVLADSGFHWSALQSDYWHAFADKSVQFDY